MENSLREFRLKFFKHILKLVPKVDAQFVILTHVLPDRPELLDAISTISPISLLIAIPYSINKDALLKLRKKHTIITPSLLELNDVDYLVEHTLASIDPQKPLIIIEIGGYFSRILHTLKLKLGDNLIGVIEDTEAGHRQYKNIENLPCPVFSVARSSLKEAEDYLVGSSCLFSTERLFRKCGLLLQGRRALILGFGKIGKGLANVLRRYCQVSVYDTNPTMRILAHSEGFDIPEREHALKNSDIIFGTTGNGSLKQSDFYSLKNGSVLVSCSSKNIEFEIEAIEKLYKRFKISEYICKLQADQQHFFLLANGEPINFIDGAVIGPVLSLVHAEIIFCIKFLCEYKNNHGLFELHETNRQIISSYWLNCCFEDRYGDY